MDKKELTMLQALPLDIKIAKSKLRIEEFVRTLGGTDKVYIIVFFIPFYTKGCMTISLKCFTYTSFSCKQF